MIKQIEPGCAIDTETNELVTSTEFLIPMIIEALETEGKEVTESNIQQMLQMLEEDNYDC